MGHRSLCGMCIRRYCVCINPFYYVRVYFFFISALQVWDIFLIWPFWMPRLLKISEVKSLVVAKALDDLLEFLNAHPEQSSCFGRVHI